MNWVKLKRILEVYRDSEEWNVSQVKWIEERKKD